MQLYIVMEYVEGQKLRDAIIAQQGQSFTEEVALGWFAQICLGLKHLHDRQ